MFFENYIGIYRADGEWVVFSVEDITNGVWRDMNGDLNRDGKFVVGEDLRPGVWNELWIDTYKNSQGWTTGTVYSLMMHVNRGSTIYWDHFYTTPNSGYDIAYYHNDAERSNNFLAKHRGEGVRRVVGRPTGLAESDDRRFGQCCLAVPKGATYESGASGCKNL